MWKYILLTVAAAIMLLAATNSARADWPMSGANPQRTSWVSDEVAGTQSTHKMKWARPIEAFISAHVNLVCTNGMIYVSTARGVVALDAVTGAVNWQYDTQMPMGDAPTYDGGYLYAPGCDRRIHKINANTGAGVWTSGYAEAAFYTNPLVISGVVYATNRDGRLYAINASTGATNWTYPPSGYDPLGPIMFSPSYYSGVIYFCSNDMHAYAVNTSGTLVWQSPKLPGVQFQSWWPTVYGDYLLIPVAHAYRFDNTPGSKSVTVQTAGENGSMIEIENDAFFPGEPDVGGQFLGPVVNNPPGTWHHNQLVRDYSQVCEYLEDNPNPVTMRHWPWMRQMVVLYRSNGQEYTMDTDNDSYPEYAPILYCGTKNGQVQPPVINGNDNVIYVNNLYTSSASDVGGRYNIVGWNFGTQYISFAGGTDIGQAMAESQILSGGGNLVYSNLLCDREGEWRNIFTGASGAYWLQGQPPQNGKPHQFTTDPYSDRMWSYKAGISDLAGFYGVIDDVSSHNGAYHNHGGDQNPLIPYIYNSVGRVYTHRSNAVICFAPEGTMTPAAPGAPLALAMFNRSKVDSLTSPTVANLKARLAREIQKIVDLPEGDMTPGYYCVGQALGTTRAMTQYFDNPGDDLYVLSKAYQQLGDYPALQADLEDYLANQWSEYFSPTAYGRRGWDIGADRIQMVIPPDVNDDMNSRPKIVSAGWGSWSYPQYNMYSMYEYANAFPSLAGTIYTRAKALIAWNYPALNQDSIWEYNAWIMGYEGFLKLQELAGQTGDVVGGRTRADIQNIRDTMMLTRANNFQKDSPYPMSSGLMRKFNFCRNFMFMCPELGDYFYDNIGTQVQDAWEEYNFVAPYWMMARYTADPQEGTMALLYHYHAMFQAAAHALKLPYDELVKYLDVPAFNVGDMFYIDDLVTAIEVGGTQEPDTTPPTPNPSTWATVPYATGSTSISMTATTASDPSGVQYFFDCTSGAGGHDSGWQSSATYQDTGLNPSTQYSYRVQTRDQSTNHNTGGWSTTQSATTQSQSDTTPPTPNPSTWATVPYATGSTTISMTATTASDPSGVQYFFDCTSGAGGHDSGWQSSATYQDTGLTPSTQYSYRVQTRDQSANQNTGGWSTTQSATTQSAPDTTPPTPNPLTWATVPYATGSTSISMTATTAADPSGVEYIFDCTAGGGHDSAWQTSPTYQDTGLTPSTQYTYRVQARDQSTNHNTGGWSTSQAATTDTGSGLMATASANPTSGTAPLQVQFTGSASGGQGGGEVTGVIDNPGFEDGGGSLTGWTYLSNATLSSSGQGYGGGYAARLLVNPTGNAIISQQITTELTPDVEYTFTGKVKVISVGNGWTNATAFRLARYNNLDQYWETADIDLQDPDWQTLTLTHTWTATDLDGGGSYPNGHFVHVGVRLNRWSATTPTEILVDDFTMSTGSGGPTYTYTWDFDNGDDSPDQNPLYTFNTAGTYDVELAVSDGYDIAYDYVTINVSAPSDTDPPTPNPLTWATAPYATGTTSVSMTATTASDPSGVEYFFDCTAGAGGHDSGWQDSTTYQDTGLSPSTQYTYRVQARDKSANQNAGGWSSALAATTDSGTDPNLVAWWEMENNADDSAGTHDGTVSGPVFVSDNGYCLEFDGGANDRVSVASSTDFDGPAGTWMLWIRTDGNWGVDGGSGGTSVKGNCAVITRHNATSSYWGLTLMIMNDGKVRLQCKNSGTLTSVTSTGTVTNNAWHHVAVTWDTSSGGDMKIFIDGSPDGAGTNSASWAFSGQDLLLGDSPDTFWEEYSGRMDDARIYDYELIQSEINAIYQQGR
jgi:hypothetical protein